MSKYKFYIFGLLGGILIWPIDAMIDVWFFSNESFMDELFHPSSLEIYFRTTVMLFMLAFATFAHVFTKKLHQSEEDFRSLFEGNRCVELIINPDSGHILEANKAAELFYGYSRKQLLTLNIADINALSREQVSEEVELAKASQSGHAIKHRRANGDIRDVEVYSGLISWKHQNALYSIIHDISARIRAEKTVHKLSQSIEQSGEAVVITDRNAVIEYVNPTFTKVTGYLFEEAVGKTPSILKSTAQDPAFYKDLWDTIIRGEVWQGTLVDRRKDGSSYPALMSIAPLYDNEGEITHFVSFQQDMTEYKQLENRFFQAQKMESIGTLVGGVAHDFNNILAAVQGNIYLAKTELDDSSKISDRLDTIEKLSENAAEMIRQLLTFARKDRVIMSPLSLNSFMVRAFKLAQNAVSGDITHTCDICQEELIINGDATQLQQVLLNLLSNASHAVKNTARPQIICSLKKYAVTDEFVRSHPELANKQLARLSVQDNGCGISNERLNKVFEPFFTTKGVGEGTGLGLAMVYGSIQTHNGTIDIATRIGKGTTFHLYFPLLDTNKTASEKERPSATQGQQETILLVDDEITMRQTIGEVLTNMGYIVIEASDGEQALQLFKDKQHNIDLVISDVVMPNMNGPDSVQQMRLINNSLPVILMTGYDKYKATNSTGEIDGAIVLSKPFSFEELSHSLRSLIKSE